MKYDNFFFHVGLHKTASTYLQRYVFPRWPGIHYLGYRNIEYFLRLSETERYLISCEGFSGATFSTLDERCRSLDRLAKMFPGANTIIGFRKHGGLIASLYSQYLRYGGSASFETFFSLTATQDQVVCRREDFSFRTLIEGLESSFGKQPFVFLLDELRTNTEGVFSDLSAFLGTNSTPQLSEETAAENASIGSWQGRLLRSINRVAGISHSPDGRNRPFPRLARWRVDPTTVCHRYLGRLPAGPLVPAEVRLKIDDAYQEDWAFVTDYIKSLPSRCYVSLVGVTWLAFEIDMDTIADAIVCLC